MPYEKRTLEQARAVAAALKTALGFEFYEATVAAEAIAAAFTKINKGQKVTDTDIRTKLRQ